MHLQYHAIQAGALPSGRNYKFLIRLDEENQKNLTFPTNDYHQKANQPSMSSMDVDRDGVVTRADFIQMAYGMGFGTVGAIAASRAFSKLDRDHNGVLTPDEQGLVQRRH